MASSNWLNGVLADSATSLMTANECVYEPQHSHDKPVKRSGLAFESLVKNAYRVLLTRGLRGCFLCFLDKETVVPNRWTQIA